MAQRICIFCGARAYSVEDAIPRWFLEHHAHLHGKGPVRRRWGALDDPERVRQGTWDGLAVQVRTVCRRCNNNWLSQLERETATLMRPMLSGIALRFYATEQRTLAFWAVKTGVILQEANRSLGLPIPSDHIVGLYRARSVRPCVLPNQITVWLAHHRGPSTGLQYLVSFSIASPGTFTPRDTAHEHRYWVGLRIGNVAFHILGHTMDPNNVRANGDPRALIRIWPAADSAVLWPPLYGFDDGEFENMARTALPRANWHRAGLVIPPSALAGAGR